MNPKVKKIRQSSKRSAQKLAIECQLLEEDRRQLPDLTNDLIADHCNALLDRIDDRINEASNKAIAK